MSGIIGKREVRGSGVANREVTYTQEEITGLGTVTSGTISTGAVIDDPTMTQGSDATGDVYYRAASGKLTRLATGADGTVLTSTGVGAVPAFEAAGGSVVGHVIQTRYITSTTAATSSDDNWMNAVADDITFEGGSNNKILAIATVRGEVRKTSVGAMAGVQILTSGTSVTAQTYYPNVYDGNGPYGVFIEESARLAFSYTISYLFTPAHDGAITVTAQGRRYGSDHTLYLNLDGETGSELILMEIGT